MSYASTSYNFGIYPHPSSTAYGMRVKVEATEKDENVSTNTTKLHVKLTVSAYGYCGYYVMNGTPIRIGIAGSTGAYSAYTTTNTSKLVCTEEYADEHPSVTSYVTSLVVLDTDLTSPITHDSDGSKTIQLYFSYNPDHSSYYTSVLYGESTKSIVLHTITRGNTITLSSSSFAMGSSTPVRISIKKNVSGSSTTLAYNLGTSGDVTFATTTSSYYDWTVPENLASYITTALSGTITIKATTTSGGVSYGSVSKTATVTVSASTGPTSVVLSMTPTNPSGTPSSLANLFIKGISQITFSATYSNSKMYGASITGYTFECANIKSSTSLAPSVLPSTILSSYGDLTGSVTITDSRGREVVGTLAISAYNHGNPKATLSAFRSTSDGTADDDGDYICQKFKASVSSSYSCGGNNVIAYLGYRVWATSGTQPSAFTAITPVASYTNEQPFVQQTVRSHKSSFYIELKVSDSLGSSRTEKFLIGSSFYSFIFPNEYEGTAGAFFGYPSSNNTFEVYGNSNGDTPFSVKNIENESAVRVDMNGSKIDIRVGSSGKKGLWSPSAEKWLLYQDGNSAYAETGVPLRIEGHTSEIGYRMLAVGSATLSNGSLTPGSESGFGAIASVTLPIGSWIVVGEATFYANGTGQRGCFLSTADPDEPSKYSYVESVSAGSSERTRLLTVGLFVTSSGTNIYLYGLQNSGSSLTATGYLRATRIA